MSPCCLVAINARYVHTSLATLQLAAACRRAGIGVLLLEGDINRPAQDWLRDIVRQRPQAVGFSCYIWNIALVSQLTRALKRVLPQLVVLWGGPEVSYDAPRRLQDTPEVDAILCGEGERTLPALLARLKQGGPLEGEGVCTRQSDGGQARLLAPDEWMDVYADFDALDPCRLWYVETARGCPYACRYCLSSVVPGGVRALPAPEAARRLLHMQRLGAKVVKLVDRSFNFDPVRARAIFSSLMENAGDCRFHFELAGHLLGEEDFALLQKAPPGLFQFEIGVQTTNGASLERAGRRMDFDRIAKAVRRIQEAGNIPIHLDLIAGLPADAMEDFRAAVDAVWALAPDRIQLGFLKLLPGSPMRADFDAGAGAYAPDAPYEVLRSDRMDFDALSTLKDVEAIVDTYYNTHRYAATVRHFLRSYQDLERVARRLRQAGFFDAGQGEMAKFEALYAALRPDGRPALLENCLRFDWLRPVKRSAFPAFVRRDADAARALLESYALRYAQRRVMHVERFEYDLQTGEPGQVDILFDYAAGVARRLPGKGEKT